MNTKIYYLYRDASNYKKPNEVIVKGEITADQMQQILKSLQDGEYFVPEMVGLPAERFGSFTEDDHVFFELDQMGFDITDREATVDMTVEDLAKAFVEHTNDWENAVLYFPHMYFEAEENALDEREEQEEPEMPTEDKPEMWLLGICNTDRDGVDIIRVQATRQEMKEYLVSCVQEDREEDDGAFEYGTDTAEEVEENGDTVLNAYGNYSNYHIDYTARLLSDIELVEILK